MREGGKISAGALDQALKHVKPGVKLSELDKIAEDYIVSHGAEPSFKKVKGYSYTTCINVNEGVVHGIPNNRVVQSGDLIKVDLGAFYKGFHTDLSHTVEVETNKHSKFLTTGMNALEEAVKKCRVGNRIGDVSTAIQTTVESEGYTVSRDLIGHGVGKELHEQPAVPGYGTPGTGLFLKEGMVLAIEVIYQMGDWDIVYEKDGWTIATRDRSLAGLFEHTVAITSRGPLVLTV